MRAEKLKYGAIADHHQPKQCPDHYISRGAEHNCIHKRVGHGPIADVRPELGVAKLVSFLIDEQECLQ